MGKKQLITTPEGVSKLMQELWSRRHQTEESRPRDNVFWVDFPPLTEEEKAAIRAKKEAELKAAKEKDDKPEDLFGAWV